MDIFWNCTYLMPELDREINVHVTRREGFKCWYLTLNNQLSVLLYLILIATAYLFSINYYMWCILLISTVYTTRLNSAFRALWLVNSEVISKYYFQVFFHSKQFCARLTKKSWLATSGWLRKGSLQIHWNLDFCKPRFFEPPGSFNQNLFFPLSSAL